ncbi:hypothetical protein VP01_1763g1 [Puccinia sorghi]|uniref:Uncharacterized protein n=1 Tax=Puccinia sorghi TaxID=27349 RepID=A0A0L6VGQ8_9BASI|nr:hypothetical protein VP01_1763g1 [Puccinia sorghi]
MVIRELNSENLKELERETKNNKRQSREEEENNRTSIINRFLLAHHPQPEEEPPNQQHKEKTGSITTNLSVGSSIPLKPRVPNYHHHPKPAAQEDQQSSIVDRAQRKPLTTLLYFSNLLISVSYRKRNKENSDHETLKSVEHAKRTKAKTSALSASIKHLPDSLPNPGRSEKPRRLTAVSGSALKNQRRNSWGGDLAFNELSFLDKKRVSKSQTKQKKPDQLKEKTKDSSHSIHTQKKEIVTSQSSSKLPIHPSGIDPCKMRQGGNVDPKSITQSARNSSFPSSGHSAYSFKMRKKAPQQPLQTIPSASPQPQLDQDTHCKSFSPPQTEASPSHKLLDARRTPLLEEYPPVEKGQSDHHHHAKNPIHSSRQDSLNHTRLIINNPCSPRSGLAFPLDGYEDESFHATSHRSSIGMLDPDEYLSVWSAAGYSNTIDNGQEEGDERLSVFDPKSPFPEGSQLFWNDENLQDLSDPLVEEVDSPWSPRRGLVAPAEGLTGEDHGNDHDDEEEQAESNGYEGFNADGSGLAYEYYDNEVYYEEDMTRLDGDSIEDYWDNDDEWQGVDEMSILRGYPEDGGMSREQSDHSYYNNRLDSEDGCRSTRAPPPLDHARYPPDWVYATTNTWAPC